MSFNLNLFFSYDMFLIKKLTLTTKDNEVVRVMQSYANVGVDDEDEQN